MKKFLFILGCLAAAGSVSMTAAFAATLIGKVTAVNPQDNSFKIEKIDESGKPDEVMIGVEDKTLYIGFKSLEDIEVGDGIQVQAYQNALTRAWKARQVLQPSGATVVGRTKGAQGAPTRSSGAPSPNDASLNAKDIQEAADPTLDQSAVGASSF